MSDSNFTKKEHYVPKCYLKQFAINESNNCFSFCSFGKDTNIKRINIDNICAVNDLYELIRFDEYVDRNVIENGFINVEGDYSLICNNILSQFTKEKKIVLSHNDLHTLKKFISLLMFRNKRSVDAFAKIMVQYIQSKDTTYEKIREILKDMDEETFNNEFKPFWEESIGLSLAHHYLKELLNTDNISPIILALIQTLGSYYCFLYSEEGYFVTSDKPVANISEDNKGVEYDIICLPISPNLCIAFFDDNAEANEKIIELNYEQVQKINGYQAYPNSDIIISNSSNNISRVVEDNNGYFIHKST